MLHQINWNKKAKWQQDMFDDFGRSCAFTGRTDNITLDHLIPRKKAYGEVENFSNLLPICLAINISKNNKNLFEWFDKKGEQLGIPEDRFRKAVEYVANKLNMTFDEYKVFYDSMYYREDKPTPSYSSEERNECESDENPNEEIPANVIDFRKTKFVMIPRKLAEDTNLTHREKIVYMTLCLYTNNESKKSFPSINTIADKAGYSRSSLVRALNELELYGYIKKENRYLGKQKQTSNVYYLLDV